MISIPTSLAVTFVSNANVPSRAIVSGGYSRCSGGSGGGAGRRASRGSPAACPTPCRTRRTQRRLAERRVQAAAVQVNVQRRQEPRGGA